MLRCSSLTEFFNKEDGATVVEYGLLAALISLSLIVGGLALGANLNDILSASGNRIASGAALAN